MVKKALTLLTSILFALPLLMPFNIYANATHQVQTEYLSTVSTQWKNSMVFTSYCEGTNASTASCVLTVNITKSPKNYFGTVTIHGYDSSGTKWINYGDIFVSAGTGVYNYNFYQNGIKEISRVEVYSTNLIQPSSTVDLSQIISLLTSINSYEQQNNILIDVIDDNTLNTVNEIKNVISQLIVSNGYLETISKLRQFDLFPESYSWCTYLFNNAFVVNENTKIYYYNYPVYSIDANKQIYWTVNLGSGTFQKLWLFFATNIYLNESNIGNYFNLSSFNVEHLSSLDSYKPIFIYRLCLTGNYSVNQNQNYTLSTLQRLPNFIPLTAGIYRSNDVNQIFPFNNELALYLNVDNRELSYLNLIANGTTASQSAADSSQSANEQLQTDSNTLFQQENGFKLDMNNAMQNVNNTFRLQDMGTKFVSSAQWVRTQYEQLTNNTPFASLITFSLITGLALILLGKVYK